MGALTTLSSGTRLYVEEHGSGGPALLCLHGLGGGAYFFTGLGEALKDRARVLAFDVPGHGFSPRDPQGFSFDRVAQHVVELARAHAAQPLTLLGHSMGVIAALKAYALAPELFRSLIFVGGGAEPLPEARARLLERAAFIRARGSMIGMGESIAPVLVSPATLKANPGLLGVLCRLMDGNDAISYSETAEALAGASASEVVPRVAVPCRLIVGAEDRYAPPASVRSFAAALHKSPAPIEFPDCGHFPFFEQPIKFHAAIAGFLGV